MRTRARFQAGVLLCVTLLALGRAAVAASESTRFAFAEAKKFGAKCEAARDAAYRISQSVECASAAEQWGELAAADDVSKHLRTSAKSVETQYLAMAADGNFRIGKRSDALVQIRAASRIYGEVAAASTGDERTSSLDLQRDAKRMGDYIESHQGY